MITWIRENAVLASLAGGLILAISTAAVAYHQLSSLVAAQPEIQRHLYDSSRHVDPEEKKRMQEEIQDLKRQVRELQAQRWERYIERQRERRR